MDGCEASMSVMGSTGNGSMGGSGGSGGGGGVAIFMSCGNCALATFNGAMPGTKLDAAIPVSTSPPTIPLASPLAVAVPSDMADVASLVPGLAMLDRLATPASPSVILESNPTPAPTAPTPAATPIWTGVIITVPGATASPAAPTPTSFSPLASPLDNLTAPVPTIWPLVAMDDAFFSTTFWLELIAPPSTFFGFFHHWLFEELPVVVFTALVAVSLIALPAFLKLFDILLPIPIFFLF